MQPDPGGAGSGGSSLDNDGMGQHCQMAQARQARRKGATRREPVVKPPQASEPSQTWWIWDGQQCAFVRKARGERLGDLKWHGPENHGEGLRRTHGEAAGEKLDAAPVNRLHDERGNCCAVALPVIGQVAGGQERRRLVTASQDGASVLVRGRESRPHGEGRQRVRRPGTGRSGGHR